MFYKDEPGCAYSFAVLCFRDRDYTEDDRLFPIDELVVDCRQSNMDVCPVDIRVKKQWISTNTGEFSKQITICIDYDNNPTDIRSNCAEISAIDSDILCAFEGLWPEIPTPFKKGDILIVCSKYLTENIPFVLEWIPYWYEDGKRTKIISDMREDGDSSNLFASIYGQDADGTIWNDYGPSYLELEYCDRTLHGTEKILIALSNCLKGELPLELLMRAYDILKTEQRAENDRELISGFYGDLIPKAGL